MIFEYDTGKYPLSNLSDETKTVSDQHQYVRCPYKDFITIVTRVNEKNLIRTKKSILIVLEPLIGTPKVFLFE